MVWDQTVTSQRITVQLRTPAQFSWGARGVWHQSTADCHRIKSLPQCDRRYGTCASRPKKRCDGRGSACQRTNSRTRARCGIRWWCPNRYTKEVDCLVLRLPHHLIDNRLRKTNSCKQKKTRGLPDAGSTPKSAKGPTRLQDAVRGQASYGVLPVGLPK